MNEEQLRKQVTGSQELERQRKSEEESLVAGEKTQKNTLFNDAKNYRINTV